MPPPMGRTGPGLKGKAPVFRGLGTLIWRSVAWEPHLGQAGDAPSPATSSSNFFPQAVQRKSYMGMRGLQQQEFPPVDPRGGGLTTGFACIYKNAYRQGKGGIFLPLPRTRQPGPGGAMRGGPCRGMPKE